MMLVGHPGTGKTRTVNVGRRLVSALPEFHLAPISLTFASLVDALDRSKCNIQVPGAEVVNFNSTYICADEMGAFIHKYDNEMFKGLAAFYDPTPYDHERRGNEIRIKIPSPQVNLITGVTPQDLLSFMPEAAWGQGFTSRIIMIFSDERIIGDDFAENVAVRTVELDHDLNTIHNLWGQFHVTPEYRSAVNAWRQLGEPPTPDHPKLTHYVTRRRTHLYKLSMVASVDRSNSLVLNSDDFNTALRWMIEAEAFMPDIFKAGSTNVDAQAIEEIYHFVLISDKGQGISEQRIVRFAKERVPLTSILRIVEIMERSGQLRLMGTERRTGTRFFSATPKESLN